MDLTNSMFNNSLIDPIDFDTLDFDNLAGMLASVKASESPLLLIRNFPNDDVLFQQFINKIGQPIIDFRSDSPIFDVTISKRNNFFRSYANSNHYFSLHTDCSDFEHIPNGLAMLCVTPAEQGGESIFIKLRDVLDHLDSEDIDWLLNKQWLFRDKQRCILSKDNGDQPLLDSGAGCGEASYKVCYNRIMLEGFAQLSSDEQAFLDRFDNLLVDHAVFYKLQQNELVVCNNHTMLHGRTDFDENSARLIKRIRFDFY